jgi:hypothetical protein
MAGFDPAMTCEIEMPPHWKRVLFYPDGKPR